MKHRFYINKHTDDIFFTYEDMLSDAKSKRYIREINYDFSEDYIVLLEEQIIIGAGCEQLLMPGF